MKKIISLALILIITFVTISYASSFKIVLKPSKGEVDKKSEFYVDVILSNIQDEKGLTSLISTLEYDKDSLELKGIESQNDWSKPVYNEDNGKFVIEKGDFTKNDETVVRITFYVTDKSKENPKITIKNSQASNSDIDITPDDVSISVKVKNGTSNPDNTDNSGNNNSENNNNNNNGSNSGNNGKNNTVNSSTNNNSNTNKSIVANINNNADNMKNGILPNAGTTSIILLVLGAAIIIALISYTKFKIVDKEK